MVKTLKVKKIFCFKRFNTIGDEVKSLTLSGDTNGLVIELIDHVSSENDDNLNNYSTRFLFSNRQVEGMRLIIYNQTSLPTLYEGINLKAGTSAQIALSKTFTTSLPWPYSTCEILENNDSIYVNLILKANKTYSYINCMDLCYQHYIIENCDCYDLDCLNLNESINQKPCTNEEQFSCLTFYYEKSKEINLNSLKCSKNCPFSCNSVEYEMSASFAGFPSRAYAEKLKTHPLITQMFKKEYGDNFTHLFTFENMRKSILRLNVYVNGLRYTEISEIEAYTVLNLVSDVGGKFFL